MQQLHSRQVVASLKLLILIFNRFSFLIYLFTFRGIRTTIWRRKSRKTFEEARLECVPVLQELDFYILVYFSWIFGDRINLIVAKMLHKYKYI